MAITTKIQRVIDYGIDTFSFCLYDEFYNDTYNVTVDDVELSLKNIMIDLSVYNKVTDEQSNENLEGIQEFYDFLKKLHTPEK